MSRIGKQPVLVPEGVTVKIEASQVTVSGPKGSLTASFRPEMKLTLADQKIEVSPKDKSLLSRALWGTTRTLIANMVEGVVTGFQKSLKLVGTGYRAVLEGENLKLSLGFSHPVLFKVPAGIKIEAPTQDVVIISGIDKNLVGQTSANIRKIRPPEPYKGKGIRYKDEVVRKKAGKAGKAGAAGLGAGGGK